MQNTPFNGAGRRPAPHPLPAIIPSPTVIYLYFVQSALCRICMYHVIQEYVAIHEMWKRKGKVPVQCTQAGRVDSLPPSSLLRWRSCGGGGGRLRAMFCLGILSGERGISGKWIRRVILAGGSGRFSWQDILAGHFGTFIWRVSTSNEKQAVEQWKRSKRNV